MAAKPCSRCLSSGLSGLLSIPNAQTISSSMRYFSLGEIQFTDNQGNSLGTGQPKEFAMDLNYARAFGEEGGFQTGVGVDFAISIRIYR